MVLVMMSTVISRREFEGEAVAMIVDFAGLYLLMGQRDDAVYARATFVPCCLH